MLGVFLGLLSSVSWGVSDFLGGLQARRISAFSVLLVSQPFGLLLAFAVAFVAGDEGLPAREAAIAAAAGMIVVIALGAFYRAMALGSVSVVATIGALGIMVPFIGGLAQGESPAAGAIAGAVVAITGVVLASREPDPEWRAAGRGAVGLAAFAALGFGTFFLLVDAAAEHDPAWTIAAARTGGVTMLLLAALFIRPSMRIPRDMWPALLAIGTCDVLANTLFAVATTHGLLALVGVVGSLYSAVTVLLARFVLGERLARAQQAGVVLALGGVALIAAGVA